MFLIKKYRDLFILKRLKNPLCDECEDIGSEGKISKK